MSNTIVKRENGKIVAIRVHQGQPLEHSAYEPMLSINHLRIRSTRKILEGKYMVYGRYSEHRSEGRKAEILAAIQETREEIRRECGVIMSNNHQADGIVIEPDPEMAKSAIQIINLSNTIIDVVMAKGVKTSYKQYRKETICA